MPQPAERLSVQRRIEFVKEHQRDFAAQRGVANQVKGPGKILGLLKEGEIESELLNFLAVALTFQGFCDLLDTKTFSRARCAEYGETERPGSRPGTEVIT